jgi:hypothetical protein
MIDLVVNGSNRYDRPLDGSVIIAAGFEFIKITSIPSSRIERADCDPA